MQFMHFSAIYAMSAVLATSVTPWYPVMHFSAIFAMFVDLGDPVVPTLRGASGDVVTVYAY